MSDPMLDIFGVPAEKLFANRELVAVHGSVERFPAFMRSGVMESTERLCRSYVGPVEVANGSAADGVQISVSDAHPATLLRLGLTVFFSDLTRLIPESRAWLRKLEASLGLLECASLSAFANSPGSGLSLHHDRFDQLFFQISGTKRFRHAPNGFVDNPDVQFSPYAAATPGWGPTYRRGFPLSSEEVLERPFRTLDLEPGSAFFMPAGTWHTTAEQDGDALSLVVAVRAPARLDLLENLLRYYVGQSPDWRARPYGGWSNGEHAEREHERLGTLLADLAERLKTLPASSAYSAWAAHAFTVGTQSAIPRGTRFARFIRLPNSSAHFEDDAASGKLRCVVHSGPTHRPQTQTVLAFEVAARVIVDWVLTTHAAFTVEETCERFPDFEREEVEELLGWLSHAALIRPLPAVEWDES